jgi:hypothetical protein
MNTVKASMLTLAIYSIPSCLKPGTNKFQLKIQGAVALDRMQLEFGHR